MKKYKRFFAFSLLAMSLSLSGQLVPVEASVKSKTASKTKTVAKPAASPYLQEQKTPTAPVAQANQAAPTSATAAQPTKVLTGQVINITSGASTPGKVDRSFSSSTSRIGDRGILTLSQAYEGIPNGSQVEFVVSSVTEPKRRFGKPGTLQLKAVNILYPDGSKVALNGEAYVVNNSGSTVLTGAATKERVIKTAGKTAAGAATGALGGLIGSAIGGGNLGRATAIGTGIGAGAGVITAGLSKGDDATVNSGDNMFLKFVKDVKLSPVKAAN
jgi:hypothetical protein